MFLRQQLLEHKDSLNHIHPFLIHKSLDDLTWDKVSEISAILEKVNVVDLEQKEVTAHDKLCLQIGIYYLLGIKNAADSLIFLNKHSLFTAWFKKKSEDKMLADIILSEHGLDILTVYSYILRAQAELAINSESDNKTFSNIIHEIEEYFVESLNLRTYETDIVHVRQISTLEASAYFSAGLIMRAREMYSAARTNFENAKQHLVPLVKILPELHFFLEDCFQQLLQVATLLKDGQYIEEIQIQIEVHQKTFEKLLNSENSLIKKLASFPQFAWCEHSTYDAYFKKYHALEQTITEIDSSSLNEEQQKIYALRCLELGIFYCQVKTDPEPAMKYLTLAELYFHSELEVNSIKAHNALCYYLVYNKTENKNNTALRAEVFRKGMECCESVISCFEKMNERHSSQNKLFAFACYVKSGFLLRNKQIDDALATCNIAINNLATTNTVDMQVLQTRLRYAKILFKTEGRLAEALLILNELETHWRNLPAESKVDRHGFFMDYGYLLYDRHKLSPDRQLLLAALEKFKFADELVAQRDSKLNHPASKTKLEIEDMLVRINDKLGNPSRLHQSKKAFTPVAASSSSSGDKREFKPA